MAITDSFSIDKKSDIPVWVQLKQRIIYCILSGQIRPGEQLPTVRELAIDLDVNYHTVNKVYRELEDIGLLEILSGKGSFVTNHERWPMMLVENDAHSAAKEYAQKLLDLGMTREEAVRAVAYHLNVPIVITETSQTTGLAAKVRSSHVG